MAHIGKEFDRVSIGVTALTVILLAAAMAPLFVVEIPAMLDYPNHLARMYLLSGPPNPAYELHWGPYPDLAMDLVVPALAHWVGVATAAKTFLGLSQILVVAGAIFLELTVKGRHRLGGPGALLVLFSLPFAWGQMNFMFGMGLAAWGVALWIRLRNRPAWIRWSVHAATVASLFISHLFDLGVYGLVIGSYELSRLGKPTKTSSLFKLAIFMASPALAMLAATWLADGQHEQLGALDWDFGLKLGWAAIFMNVYDTPLSMLTAAALLFVVLVLVVARRMSLTREGIWIAGGLLAAYVALPRQISGSQYLDVRLLTAAALILPAFINTPLPSGLWRAAPLTVVIAIIAANEATSARAWFDYERDYTEFRKSFAQLTAGSAVLIGQRDQAGRDFQPVFYAATLAAPFAGVFVSSLYAHPGAQPLQPRTRYQELAVKAEPECYPPRLAALRAAIRGSASAGTQANLVNWPARYRYLYLLGARGPNPLPATLTLLAVGRRFSLYRIVR